MSEDVRVRPARLEDAAAIADLCAQLGYPTTTERVAKHLPLLVAPHYGVFVADTGEVIGWIVAQAKVSLHAGCFAEVTGLVVNEKRRGEGIGTRLLRRAEEWASEHGYQQVWLRSNIKRTEAHRFYQRLGYELLKTSYTFRKMLAANQVAGRQSPVATYNL